MSTATATKPLTSRQGVEEALIRLADTGVEEVTTSDVQQRAAKIADAVKDGYAAFWLTKFNAQGVHVERVKRGTYRLLDTAPAAAANRNGIPSVEELQAKTKKDLVTLADTLDVQVTRSANKAKIVAQLAEAAQ